MISFTSKFLVALNILFCLNALEVMGSVHLKDIICKSFDESIVEINECLIHNVKQNTDAVKLNISFAQTINTAELKIDFKRKDSGSKKFDTEKTINLCNADKKEFSSAANFLYKQLMESTNLLNKCPYKDFGVINDFYPRINFLHKLFMPNGEFGLNMTWFFNGIKVMGTELNLLLK